MGMLRATIDGTSTIFATCGFLTILIVHESDWHRAQIREQRSFRCSEGNRRMTIPLLGDSAKAVSSEKREGAESLRAGEKAVSNCKEMTELSVGL